MKNKAIFSRNINAHVYNTIKLVYENIKTQNLRSKVMLMCNRHIKKRYTDVIYFQLPRYYTLIYSCHYNKKNLVRSECSLTLSLVKIEYKSK